jgi:hypothetical protein
VANPWAHIGISQLKGHLGVQVHELCYDRLGNSGDGVNRLCSKLLWLDRHCGRVRNLVFRLKPTQEGSNRYFRTQLDHEHAHNQSPKQLRNNLRFGDLGVGQTVEPSVVGITQSAVIQAERVKQGCMEVMHTDDAVN